MSKSTERFWERVDWLKERKAHGCKGVWSSVRSGCAIAYSSIPRPSDKPTGGAFNFSLLAARPPSVEPSASPMDRISPAAPF